MRSGPIQLQQQIIRVIVRRLRGLWGYWDGRSEIHIDDRCDAIEYLTTWVHEVTEAANDIYDIGLRHDQIESIEAAIVQSLLTYPGSNAMLRAAIELYRRLGLGAAKPPKAKRDA